MLKFVTRIGRWRLEPVKRSGNRLATDTDAFDRYRPIWRSPATRANLATPFGKSFIQKAYLPRN